MWEPGHVDGNDRAGPETGCKTVPSRAIAGGTTGASSRRCITWRALPERFGNWNSVWKRFWRLSRSGVFEAFFQLLAEQSDTAHLVQFFDSTTVRAHVSAAGAKGGNRIRRSVVHAAVSRPRSISRPTSRAYLSTST